jgi:hypothetical protein
MKNKSTRRHPGGVKGKSSPLSPVDEGNGRTVKTVALQREPKSGKPGKRGKKAKTGKLIESLSAPGAVCDQGQGSISTDAIVAAEYRRVHSVDVRGATAPDGTPWVELVAPGGCPSAWTPFDALSDDAAPAKKAIRAAGIYLFKEDLAKVVDQARGVTSFPPMPLIERPGWSRMHYALLSGEVFSPDSAGDAIVLFDIDPLKCKAAGTKAWLQGVACLAKGQPIVTFALTIAFAGPILDLSRVRENPGFEFSGPKGVGKTTLLYLAASVWGPALEPAGRNYWISANATINAIEAEFPRHADSFLAIEEMSAMNAGESAKARANHTREFIFRTAQGTTKSRYQVAKERPVRFAWMATTNDPAAMLLGDHGGDAAEATGDRLLAIPISRKRLRGIFQQRLPAGCVTGEEAARAIAELVSEHYGHPIRRFLKALVTARAEGEDELRAQIETYILEFRDAVGADGNVGSEARVADSFAVVYAAGKLAQTYGALPPELDCLQAATYCYEINRKSVGAAVTNVQRLERLAKRKGVVVVDLNDKSEEYRQRLAEAPAEILPGKGGTRELLLSMDAVERAFRRPRSLFADPAVSPLMRHDAKRNAIKVKLIHDGKMERRCCFKLPSSEG